MMKNDKIYIDEWLTFKPYFTENNIDLYYLKLSNKVYNNLDEDSCVQLLSYIEHEDIKLLCCFLVCYLEDVISGTNVWFSFKKIHQELYRKSIPFYELDDTYFEDEINVEDLQVLTWYFINTILHDEFVNPFNSFIQNIAKSTIQVLDDDYEYAPENRRLKKFFELDKNSDFYQTREYMQKVFFSSYLFYTDITLNELEELSDTANEFADEPSVLEAYFREIHEKYTFNYPSALLSLNANEWCAQIIGASHPLHDSIRGISQRVLGYFFIKGQDKEYLLIEHIASGKPFKLTKKSFDDSDSLEEDDIIFIGLVNWKNEWWFSGNYIKQGFDADLILDLKNSEPERASVNFLEDQELVSNSLKTGEKMFKSFNNGSLIAFVKESQIEPFINSYLKFHNSSLNLSEKEQQDAIKRAAKDGYFGKENDLTVFSKDDNDESAIVFYNLNAGIEVFFGITDAFPDKNNPFFNEVDDQSVIELLLSKDCSTELVNYFMDNYKDKIPLLSQFPYNLYLDNLDFLLRFWKKDHYKSKSSIVFTGKSK